MKERSSNIELLRILAAMGVIVLHFNGRAMNAESAGAVNLCLSYVTEAVCIGAVDLFLIIGGYFQCKKESIALYKPLALLAQVSFFRGVEYLFNTAVTGSVFSPTALLCWLVPTNYFVDTYVAVLLLSPFANRLLKSLSLSSLKKLLVLLAILFSALPCFIDRMIHFTGDNNYQILSVVSNKGDLAGYTFVNYLFMFILGASIRRFREEGVVLRRKTLYLLAALAVGGEIAVSLLSGLSVIRSNLVYAYNSPLVILSAAAIFCMFLRLKMGSRPIINHLARASFTVYLTHRLPLRLIPVESFAAGSFPVYACVLLGTALGLYAVGYAADLLYRGLTFPVGRWFRGTKLAAYVID